MVAASLVGDKSSSCNIYSGCGDSDHSGGGIVICAKCNKHTELNKGFFKDAGMVPGLQMKRKVFICNDCRNAIDVTSREPGEDDDIPETNW